MKKCNIVKARKFKKKNKKNRERADVYGCIGIGGGGVYLQHIATLVWFVANGFSKGNTRQRSGSATHCKDENKRA